VPFFVSSIGVRRIWAAVVGRWRSAPRRTRTFNPLIKSQRSDSHKAGDQKGLRLLKEDIAPPLPHRPNQADSDPNLVELMEAWPILPPAAREAIMGMVKAFKPRTL